MSNLNENEQKFIRELLALMNGDVVKSLTATITRRMVKVNSIPACIDAIVLHTASLDEFLKRQKVTKEHLFRYLNDRKISVPNTDKAALELQIKQYVNGVQSDVSPVARSNLTPTRTPDSQALVKPDILDNTEKWNNQQLCNVTNSVNPASWNEASAAGIYNTTVRQVTMEQQVTRVTSTTIHCGGVVSLPPSLPDSQETTVTNEFAKWFYPRINQIPGVLPEDFWPDANLKLSVRGSNNVLEKSAVGGTDVAKTLNGTLEEHQLFLHPNLSSEGVWGRSNANGLLLVLVCGTLHHRSAHHCLGVFENLFLLAQDPFAADNWKIRTLEAILRSRTQVQQPLTLQESELALSLQ